MRLPDRDSNTRMFTLQQGAAHSGMGITFFKKWATEIGARVEFSPRVVRYDREIIDRALDEMHHTMKKQMKGENPNDEKKAPGIPAASTKQEVSEKEVSAFSST